MVKTQASTFTQVAGGGSAALARITSPATIIRRRRIVGPFGTNQSLRRFAPQVTVEVRDVLALSERSSTWDIYFKAHGEFENFTRLKGVNSSFPVTVDILADFFIHLDAVMKLPLSTIQIYIAGLKVFHVLGEHSTDAFESSFLKLIVKGIKNKAAVMQSMSNMQQFGYAK